MNNELIERINNKLSSITSMEKTVEELFGEGGMKEYRLQVNLLRDCKAALTQQQEAEPFGWFTEDYADDKSATTYDPEVAERWRAKGWPVTALYLHPPKPAAQVSVVQNIMKAGTLGAEFEQALMKNLSSLYECGDKSPAAHPQVPDIMPDLNYLYWSAYHAGHNDTVEGRYTDVYSVDRFDYWTDAVEDCLRDGDMPALSAAQPQVPEGALRIDLTLSDKHIRKMLWVSEVRSSNMKLVAHCADEAWQELSAAKGEP